MNPEHRFVFDTNVLVSAFLFRNSKPRQALDLAFSIGKVVCSEETLDELWGVLVRPKFDRYLPISDRITLLRVFEQLAEKHTLSSFLTLCRDPKDDIFLNLALSARAKCITTGDDDLLVLRNQFDIPIVTPVEFLLQNQESRL